jgi:hypothetical protein
MMGQLVVILLWRFVSLQNGLQNHANMTLEMFLLLLGAHLNSLKILNRSTYRWPKNTS